MGSAAAPLRMAGMAAGRASTSNIHAALGIGSSIEAGLHNRQQSRFGPAVTGGAPRVSGTGSVDDFEDEGDEESSSRDPFGRDTR